MVLFLDINTVVLFLDIKTEEIPKGVGSCVALGVSLLALIHWEMQQKILGGLLGTRHCQPLRFFLGLVWLAGQGGVRWGWRKVGGYNNLLRRLAEVRLH